MPAMKVCDYGFKASVRSTTTYKVPKSFVKLAVDNVKREVSYARYGFVKTQQRPLWASSKDMRQKKVLRQQIANLKLDNELVWKRESAREPVDASPIIYTIYYALCFFLDVVFRNRPIQRFWFLETVARMPYFSYVAVLHLYETLGWWSIDSELRTIHNDEDANEGNHLLIMESLGGNALWADRFLARHSALLYYMVLLVLFLFSPKTAYNSSELLEMHAVDTYSEFLHENEDLLKTMPPPLAALEYYNTKQKHTLDPQSRYSNPVIIRTLYDVFDAICTDEQVHAESMRFLRKSTT